MTKFNSGAKRTNSVIRRMLEHPVLTLVSIAVIFVLIEELVLDRSEYPFGHGDDIVGFTWGILLSIIATTVTAYVFMYQTNKTSKSQKKYLVESTDKYESHIKRMLSAVSIMTMAVVITSIISFSSIVNLEGNWLVPHAYAIISGTSVSIVLANLIVMLAIIQSSGVIADLSVHSEKKLRDSGSENRIKPEVKEEVFRFKPSPVEEMGGEKIQFKRYLSLIEPLDKMIFKMGGFELSGDVAVKTWRQNLLQRIASSEYVDGSFGQLFYNYLRAKIELQGTDLDTIEEKKLIPLLNTQLDKIQDECKIITLYDTWIINYILLYVISKNNISLILEDLGIHIRRYDFLKAAKEYSMNSEVVNNEELDLPLSPFIMKRAMSFRELSELDFTGSDLRNMSFLGSNMTGCKFTDCLLDGSDMTDTILRRTYWTGADEHDNGLLLTGADLSDATFGQIKLNGRTDLCGARLSNNVINSPNLDGVAGISLLADSVTVNYGYLCGCAFDDVTLDQVIFHECKITMKPSLGMTLTFGYGSEKSKTISNISLTLYKKVQRMGEKTDENPQKVRLFSSNVDQLEIRFSDSDLEKYVDNLLKNNIEFEIVTKSFFSSENNIETDWEKRPWYKVTLTHTSDKKRIEIILEERLKQSGDGWDNLKTVPIAILDHCSGKESGMSEPVTNVSYGCDFEGSQFNSSRIWNSKVDSANMRNIDLRDCSFFGSNFFNTDFDSTRFEKIDLSNSTSVRGQYIRCSFVSSKFTDADIENNDFTDCVIKGVIISDSIIDSCTFNGSTLDNVTLINCTIINLSPSVGWFSRIYFERCRLIENDEGLYKNVECDFRDCIRDGKPFSKSKDGRKHGTRESSPCAQPEVED